MRKIHILYFFALTTAIIYIHSACNNAPQVPPKSEEYLKGEVIARRLCSSCHQYTPPELLDQISWPNVMTAMKSEMEKAGQEPDYEDWIDVQRFYLTQAPRVFQSTTTNQPDEQKIFELKSLNNDSTYLSRSTLLHFDSSSKSTFIGQENGFIYQFANGEIIDQIILPNIPIDMIGEYILGMGSLAPSEDPNGELYQLHYEEFNTVMDWFNRPIHVEQADLNNNEKVEFVLSEFGSLKGQKATGGLYLVIERDEKFEKVLLDSLPGATMTKIVDLNKDGRQDIVALFNQGNEMIKVFYNLGELQFNSSVLIKWPPVYGTNSFDLTDIDKDGDIDILVTNGDNDDYSQVFKKYHGIRLFVNDGNNSFEERYHYHINGASKVIAADFDKDQDIDFVVQAMYPDLFSRPWENMLFFENKNRLKFKPHFFEASSSDNWILMERGDIDNDGDVDIIIGAHQGIHGLLPRTLLKTWQEKPIGIQVWENQAN